jgi:hypothetical protein
MQSLHGRKPSRIITAGFPSRKETFPYCYSRLSFTEGNLPVLLRLAFLHGRKHSRTATAGFPSWKETFPYCYGWLSFMEGNVAARFYPLKFEPQ